MFTHDVSPVPPLHTPAAEVLITREAVEPGTGLELGSNPDPVASVADRHAAVLGADVGAAGARKRAVVAEVAVETGEILGTNGPALLKQDNLTVAVGQVSKV